MKQVTFKQANTSLKMGEKSIPALVERGMVITAWKPTFWERVKIFFGKKIFLISIPKEDTVQPASLSVEFNLFDE